jgi:hypothetical protein
VAALADLQRYLGVPFFRMSIFERHVPETGDWEYIDRRPVISQYDIKRFAEQFALFLLRKKSEIKPVAAKLEEPVVSVSDLSHFCSFLVNQDAVDYIAERYGSFCIIGMPNSIPYLETKLKSLNKEYFYWCTLTPPERSFDCVLQTGSWGMPRTDKPIFDLLHAEPGRGRPINVPQEISQNCPPFIKQIES